MIIISSSLRTTFEKVSNEYFCNYVIELLREKVKVKVKSVETKIKVKSAETKIKVMLT